MKKISYLLLCGVLLGIFSATAFAQEQLVIGETQEGIVDYAVGEFIYTAKSGENVFIDVVSENFDPAVEVYDSLGTFLISDDNSGEGSNARIGLRFSQDGDYRISVTSYIGQLVGAFNITVTPLEIVTEGQLEIGGTVQSLLTEDTPKYSLELAEQTDLLFIGYSYNVSLLIQVRDAVGNIIATNRDSYSNRISVTLLAGQYTVELGNLYADSNPLYAFYSLNVQKVEKQVFEYGNKRIINAEGQSAIYITFEAEADDVIGIVASIQNEVSYSFSFVLYAPSGIISNYSENGTRAAYLQRVILRETGTYTVEITPYSENFNAPISVSVSEMSLISLDEEAQTLIFDQTVTSDTVVFTAKANTAYRLSVQASNENRNYSLYVMNEMTQVVNFNMYGGTGFTIDFTSQNAGTYSIGVRSDNYDEFGSGSGLPDLTEVTISIAEVE